MKEKASRKKEGSSPSLVQCSFNAITVGSGRHAEPYIIAFHHQSDNVAGRDLGTLFGFFEVEIHDEDAAYIVNFLASVAKKEYFANPRRSVSDGFETTLHKINVALAEITKEGNVSWLGHLHGILGAVSDNTVHFSATGDGVLALVRDNTLRPISDGLAEVSSEPHPLKTFTEVSSGRLLEHDVLLALSPAVWTLFTPDDLKKNLHRLGQAGFEQFLHTALINELSIAGAVVVSVSNIPTPAAKSLPRETKEGQEEAGTILENVWSHQAFEKAREKRLKALTPPPAQTQPEPRKEEYVDQKTGHIYVQGETETHAEEDVWKTRLALWSQAFSRHWQIQCEKFYRFTRRSRKNFRFMTSIALERSQNLSRRALRRMRTVARRLREARTNRQEQHTDSTVAPPPSSMPTPGTPAPQDHASQKEALLVRIRQFCSTVLQISLTTLRSTYLRFTLWWQQQTKRQQAIFGGGALVLLTLTLGIWFYVDRSSVWETVETQPMTEGITQTLPPEPVLGQNEPLAKLLTDGRALSTDTSGKTLTLASINGSLFDVSENRILNLDTKEATLPPEPIRLATAMDDLDALFLMSTSGTLLMYTPGNKKFGTSTFSLPVNTTVSQLGAYLTYLYVLDEKAGVIYRLPRAEGGFGEPVTWSKESLALKSATPFTVFENIAVVLPNGEPTLYSRGRKTTASFTGPQTPVETTGLAIDQKNGDVLVLDSKNKRVIRWSSTGTLLAQYFHETLANATHITLNQNNELVAHLANEVRNFPIP